MTRRDKPPGAGETQPASERRLDTAPPERGAPAAFLPRPGEHPLRSDAGRAILRDLDAASTAAQLDACLARLITLVIAAAPTPEASSAGATAISNMPRGEHPLSGDVGRAILSDVDAANTRAEWDRCWARVFAFLYAHAAPGGAPGLADALWVWRAKDAIGKGFTGARPHAPVHLLQAREDAWLLRDVLCADGVTINHAAKFLAGWCGIDVHTARARVERACRVAGVELGPGPRPGKGRNADANGN